MEANHQHHRRNQRLNPNYEQLLANDNVIHAMGGTFLIRKSKLLDIVLRLPPLFLMDQILLYDMGLNYFANTAGDSTKSPLEPKVHFTFSSSNVTYASDLLNEESFWKEYGSVLTTIAFNHFVSFAACANLFWFSLLWIGLTTRQLVSFYTYMMAFACVPLSFLANCYTMNLLHTDVRINNYLDTPTYFPLFNILRPENVGMMQIPIANYMLQIFLGLILSCVLRLHVNNNLRGNEWLLHRFLTLPLLLPTSLALIGIKTGTTFHLSSVISIIPALVISIYIFSKVLESAVRSVIHSIKMKRQFVLNFGFNTFLEAEWVRLRIPSLLRTFWLTRMMQQLFSMMIKTGPASQPELLPFSDAAARAAVMYMLDIGRELIIRGAETLIALLGMTSVVSKICHYVGSLFHIAMSNTMAENEEEKSVASVSAILFFILALQTGLTSLDPEKRFARICKNLCLLLTALFHFIHNNVSPVLMGLTAGHKALDIKRHIRALSICLFLIVASMSLMIVLWKWFTVGTWLLAVSAFCIEVVVKVLVTVSVYALFLYDSRVREGTWEFLDDAVYYVKAVGNTVEFCFAVFLFFNGGWILFFESGGTIRATMMVVHAYFNIWCEAKVGWKTFIKRRTAAAKINSLPFASEEALRQHDDVCAICYQDMLEAKVTRCKHFFHSMCLRKWLYMQDTCPLCHAVLYKETKVETKQEENNESDEADSSSDEDVMDLDDPPFQAAPPAAMEEDSDEDQEESSSSESTQLSSTDEDDILFDNSDNDNNIAADPEDFEDQPEEDLIQLMDRIDSSRSSSGAEEEETIDR